MPFYSSQCKQVRRTVIFEINCYIAGWLLLYGTIYHCYTTQNYVKPLVPLLTRIRLKVDKYIFTPLAYKMNKLSFWETSLDRMNVSSVNSSEKWNEDKKILIFSFWRLFVPLSWLISIEKIRLKVSFIKQDWIWTFLGTGHGILVLTSSCLNS